MNRVFWTIIGLLILSGCNKQEENIYIPGKIITQVNYRGAIDNSLLKNYNSNSDDHYTGFGDYITSLTPHVFKAKFICIRYVDELSSTFNQMELLDNNLPYKDSLKYADFTNNSSVTMKPGLGGNLVNEGASFGETVVFKYFYFRLEYFHQEVHLPEQYAGVVKLDQFDFTDPVIEEDWDQHYGSLSNNILVARYRMFLAPLFDAPIQRLPDGFVFGGTDSSYIVNLLLNPEFPNIPHDGDYVVVSKNYTPITFEPNTGSEKTTLINATLTFDYNNLIQIYAGQDNIPYTKDDVFLYPPNFEDRIMVNVIIE